MITFASFKMEIPHLSRCVQQCWKPVWRCISRYQSKNRDSKKKVCIQKLEVPTWWEWFFTLNSPLWMLPSSISPRHQQSTLTSIIYIHSLLLPCLEPGGLELMLSSLCSWPTNLTLFYLLLFLFNLLFNIRAALLQWVLFSQQRNTSLLPSTEILSTKNCIIK